MNTHALLQVTHTNTHWCKFVTFRKIHSFKAVKVKAFLDVYSDILDQIGENDG